MTSARPTGNRLHLTSLCLCAVVMLPACSSSIAGLSDADFSPDLGTGSSAGLIDMSGSALVLGPFDLAPDPNGPPYPIVLVHGMAGFKNIGPIEYFYGVPEALRKDGHDVWISQQDPIADSDVRGPEVVAFVQTVLTMTGKHKVNLIGHSQGGFDVRYVASVMGSSVIASVTTIGAPMLGDPIADLALSAGPGADVALNVLLDLYGVAFGYPPNAQAQLQNLSAAGAAAFFAAHPDDPLVPYYSIAGRSDMSNGGTDCDTEYKPDFIAKWDAQLDLVDPLLLVPAQILDGLNPKPVHDALVTVASATHGVFLGCIPADHMEEVHQFLGAQPGGGNTFDAIQFYRDLVNWLVNRGF